MGIQIKGDICVSALKKCEDTDEYLVRFYEPHGNTESVKISLCKNASSIRHSDMLEYGGEKEIKASIETSILPYSIETYCLEVKK